MRSSLNYCAKLLSRDQTSISEFWDEFKAIVIEMHREVKTTNLPEYIDKMHAPLIDYLRTIISWAREYNLTDAWLFSEAQDTLFFWSKKQNLRSKDWAYNLNYQSGSIFPDGRIFRWGIAWDSEAEKWKSYEKKALESFQTFLKAHRELVEIEKKKTSVYEVRSEQHFVWLVEWQINGKLEDEIAQNEKGEDAKDISSVSQGITRLANLIGLTKKNYLK